MRFAGIPAHAEGTSGILQDADRSSIGAPVLNRGGEHVLTLGPFEPIERHRRARRARERHHQDRGAHYRGPYSKINCASASKSTAIGKLARGIPASAPILKQNAATVNAVTRLIRIWVYPLGMLRALAILAILAVMGGAVFMVLQEYGFI